MLHSCQVLSVIPIVLTILNSFAMAGSALSFANQEVSDQRSGFATFRCWAMCSRFSLLVFAVFLCSMFEPCINIVSRWNPWYQRISLIYLYLLLVQL